MGITLVVNPGSSSKKYSLFDGNRQLFAMRFERSGAQYGVCRVTKNADATCQSVAGEVYKNALRMLLDEALFEVHISNLKDIESVGVRIVAPGTYFTEHREIDRDFEQKLKRAENSAPLHIPHTRYEIAQVKSELPFSKVYGVSDSEYYKALPFEAKEYSINRTDAKEFDIHKFGYHGLSVSSVVQKIPELFGEMPKRIIVLHVGSGVSATAVLDGKPIDTSMGYSPVSGLVMGTRAGDIDPGALLELMRARHLSIFDAHTYINSSGGLLGLSGVSDFRQLLERVSHNDEMATRALDVFIYHLTKTIGAFQMVLGGLDAIVVTATAVERNSDLRRMILSPLSQSLSLFVDEELNQVLINKDGMFSSKESKVKLAVIRTDEMSEIARVVERVQS